MVNCHNSILTLANTLGPFSCAPATSNTSLTIALPTMDLDTLWMQVCQIQQMMYLSLFTLGPKFDGTYLHVCVDTTIEHQRTTGEVNLCRSGKTQNSTKSHLDGASCCWKETNFTRQPQFRYFHFWGFTVHYTVSDCVRKTLPATRSSSGVVLSMMELRQQTKAHRRKSQLYCVNDPNRDQRVSTSLP